MGREPAEALESAVTGGGLESPAIEAGELGPAGPALDVAGGDIKLGETGPGGESGDGLAEPGELGPAGLEPGGDMWPEVARDDLEPGDATGEPGEAGPADAPDRGLGRGIQETGETAEKGIETAERDVESAGQGIGRDAAEAISAIEAAGEALTQKGAGAGQDAGPAGLGHAVSGREGGTGGSAIEHGIRSGLHQDNQRDGGYRREQSGTREHQER